MASNGIFGAKTSAEKLIKTYAMIAITIVAVISSVFSSYLYYTSQTDLKGGYLVSGIVYSTIKFFLFSPISGVDQFQCWWYELARWISPLCTTITVISMLELLFLNQLNHLRTWFGKKTIFVFSYNDDSKIFIDNIVRSHGKVVVIDDELSSEAKGYLAYHKVSYYVKDVTHQAEGSLGLNLIGTGIHHAKAIVLFYPTETRNLAVYLDLVKYIEKTATRPIPCSINCSKDGIKQFVSDYIDSKQMNNESKLDLKLFDTYEISVRKMFVDFPIFASILPEEIDLDTLCKYYPENDNPWNVHMLILGFGKLGEQVLLQTINEGVLQSKSKIRIDIYDIDMENKSSSFLQRYPEIEKAAVLNFKKCNVESSEFLKEIHEIKADPITYVTICFENLDLSIMTLQNIMRHLSGVTTVVRMNVDSKVMYDLNNREDYSYKTVHPFADRESILTEDAIVNMRFDNAAKATHELHLMNNRSTVPWNKLGTKIQNANRAQIAHARYMATLLSSYWHGEDWRAKVKEIDREALFAEFERYYEEMNSQEDKPFCDENFSETFHLFKELVAIEHRRWCNFQYRNGYRYCATRCDANLEHNCLQAWDLWVHNDQFISSCKYDLGVIFLLPDYEFEKCTSAKESAPLSMNY